MVIQDTPNPFGGKIDNAELGTDLAIGNAVTIIPTHVDITAVAGTWAVTRDAGFIPFGVALRNTTTADADNFTFPLWLSAGTYTITTYTMNNTNCGIMKIDIDTTNVVTLDCYAGSATHTDDETTSIAVSTSGLKTIKVKVDGKNGSSSDYKIDLGLF